MRRRHANSGSGPSLSRRDWLRRSAAAGATLAFANAPFARAAAPPGAPLQEPPTAPPSLDEASLDEALVRLHASEPRPHGGVSSHAPMTVEALVAIGCGGRVASWLTRFEKETPRTELAARAEPMAADQWRAALAQSRWGDWVQLFERELAEARWQEVLDRWAPRFAPGYCAAAMHGVIRTAHAARALGRKETAPRRAEFARGLAYWAAWYQELPGRAAVPAMSFEESLALLPLHRVQHGAAPGGNLVNGLARAAALERFPAPGGVAALAGEPAAALAKIVALMASAYLRHGTQHDAIGFVHAVTGPAALRKLAAHAAPATTRPLLPFAWQAAQGIYAAYAGVERESAALEFAPPAAAATLAGNAADHGDAHVIKFAEALLAEHALHPDALLLAAAADVPRRF